MVLVMALVVVLVIVMMMVMVVGSATGEEDRRSQPRQPRQPYSSGAGSAALYEQLPFSHDNCLQEGYNNTLCCITDFSQSYIQLVHFC